MKRTIMIMALIVGTMAFGEVEIAKALPWNEGAPRVNGPKVFGATPEKYFSYTFPVCGSREGMKYVLTGDLPKGVKFDAKTGKLEGRASAGEYKLVFTAKNGLGTAKKDFRLIVGDGKLGLTPAMGWTSWHFCGNTISDAKVRETAQQMVERGFAARGWTYVNIDAGWAEQLPDLVAPRRMEGLLANEKFPNMKALTDDLHAMGLKCGIYSSPMTRTWGGDAKTFYPGSTAGELDENYTRRPKMNGKQLVGIGKIHLEEVDAQRWASWGFDFLKYDWPWSDPGLAKQMRDALDKVDRDFLFQLCTTCSPQHIDEFRGVAQLVRGNEDSIGDWKHKERGTPAIMYAVDKWLKGVGPGYWYDLDMLAIGKTGHIVNKMTRDEQIFQFVYWAVIPCPLFLSCDLATLDGWLYDLVNNEELLAINQDELGAMVKMYDRTDKLRIAKRKLSSGKWMVAFFNVADDELQISVDEIGAERVRDILALRDISVKNGIAIAPHSARVFTF